MPSVNIGTVINRRELFQYWIGILISSRNRFTTKREESFGKIEIRRNSRENLKTEFLKILKITRIPDSQIRNERLQ